MIAFDKPKNLNGTKLRQELNDAGVVISNEMHSIVLDDSNTLWLDIAENDAEAAKAIVAAHNGTI